MRDLSQLHIEALSNKDVANKRIVVHGHPYSHGFSATVLRELGDSGKIPELKGRVAKDNENDNPPHPKYREDDEGVKKFVDDRKYRTKEETFGDAAKKILELEKERK